MSEDFYEVLGVSRDADKEEIERAYRKKAAEYHPDVSDDPEAEEKFKKIKTAKEVLTDDQKRQAYDRLGHDRFVEAQKRGGFDDGAADAGGGPFGGAGGDPFGGMGGMEDIFEQFFGGSAGSRRRQGQDLKTTLSIDLEEAYEGVTKEFTVTRPERCGTCGGDGHPPGADARTCPECNGQGQTTQVRQTPLGRVQQTQTCRRCEGEGTLYSERCSECGGGGTVRNEATLRVDVPAGIESGQTLRMEREGAPGEDGGPNGDLLVEIRVNDHPEFERDGEDLHHRKAVSFPQAVFGDTVEIPTLDGPVETEIEPGTQSGETLRLRGKGMPRLRGRSQGDLYVELHVVTPTDLNDEQREALERFAEAGGEEIDIEQGFFERIKNSL